MASLRIGIAQLESEIGRIDYDPRPRNQARALGAIRTLHGDGAQLVVFGEVFLNGYESGIATPDYAITESDDDPWLVPIIDLAAELGVHVLLGATTVKDVFPAGETYNSAIMIGPEGIIGVYSKAHLAAFGWSRAHTVAELAWWSTGHEIPVFDTSLGRIGVEICYDILFPESARTLVVKGAELVINISAAVTDVDNELMWDRFLYTRAVENRVPYLHVSIVGTQPMFDYFGGARLFSPTGAVIGEAPRYEEALVTMDLDTAIVRRTRGLTHQLRARRPDLYGAIIAPSTPTS